MYVMLLADGFEEVEAVTPADFLRRAGVDLCLVGVSGTVVEGSHGIRIEADMSLDQLTSIAGEILEGRRVTCYPGFEERFADTGALMVEERMVEDGNLVTSRGPGTAAEFAVRIIERIAGREKALEIHRKTLQKA